jgi:hypothetical protein
MTSANFTASSNIANMFIDENGVEGYTVGTENGFYKIPQDNIHCWFPEYYNKRGNKGHFQRFQKRGKHFYAIYHSDVDGTDFTVDRSLKIVQLKK